MRPERIAQKRRIFSLPNHYRKTLKCFDLNQKTGLVGRACRALPNSRRSEHLECRTFSTHSGRNGQLQIPHNIARREHALDLHINPSNHIASAKHLDHYESNRCCSQAKSPHIQRRWACGEKAK
jgi:hypothetical protein